MTFKLFFTIKLTESMSVSPSSFAFSLSSHPTSRCTLTLSSGATPEIQFLPSSTFTYDENSLSLERTFRIIPAVSKIYNISIQTTANCPNKIDPDYFTLLIRRNEDPPAAPGVTRVYFSDDGSAIFMFFDTNTDRIGYISYILYILYMFFFFDNNLLCFA